MSSVRLEQVTVEFSGAFFSAPLAPRRGSWGSQTDRAFTERALAQMETERAARSGRGGKVLALDGVDLRVPDGQTMAIVGPSGCGKSTLLRVVAGLIGDYTGQVWYDDQDMRDVPAKDRYIGMVFQSYALYPHFKGHGNLGFFFKVHKAPDKEAEERIRATSEIMGIGFDQLLRRKPGTLSGGQQQRLAIGRAIVRNPRLFLFDEPLSNLDAKLRIQTRVEIKRLLRRFQITSLYVTHDQVEATTLGDQIAVMRDGKIEQVGSYRDLLDDPASAFVAGFLGIPPMNLFRGVTVADTDLLMGDIAVPISAAARERIPAHSGQGLILGWRPDAAYLVFDGQDTPEGVRLQGTVESVEPDFSRRTQLVYVRTGPHFFGVQGPLEPVIEVGEGVEVVLPLDQLYFFDAQSEQRLTARVLSE